MKSTTKAFFSLIVLLGMLHSGLAQDKAVKTALEKGPEMRVEQRQVSWIRNDYTAHTMLIHSEAKELEKEFEKFMKSRYKMKFSNARGWREVPGVVMPDIIAETVIFAFSTEKESDGARLRVIVDLGGASLNAREHPQAASNLEQVLREFARSVYASAYSDLIDEEKKQLKSEEKALGALTKARKKHEKEQAQAEKAIKKLEKELEKQRKVSADAKKAIEEGAKELSAKEAAVKERNERVGRLRKQADKVRR